MTGRPAPRSLWLEEALAVDSDTPLVLEGDQRADVCIVGGGFTGLWTAIHLKELRPGLTIVLIEGDVCGGGASGRNGGFLLSWWAKFETLVKLCGAKEALRLAAASEQAAVEIGAFCRRHAIDAQYRPDGWLWAATNQAQVGAWTTTLRELERHGVQPFRELEPKEVAQLTGSPTHLTGVLEPNAATVQPALLARGLRKVALERGVRVFEGSPMTSLDRARPPRVRTPGGSVTADRVVLAVNAWATRFPEIRRALLVIGSDIVATEPIPAALEQIGWTSGLAISDSRLLVNYYRTTLDGRIVFGKGGGTVTFAGRVSTAFHGASPRRAEVEDSFRTLYPELRDVRVTTSWTGPVARTMTGLPSFGQLGGRPDIVYGTGYSGNGVGPSYLGGRILASLALKLDDEWAETPLAQGLAGRFPPEPARYVGAHLVRRAVARKERDEDMGRRPSPAVLALARLAPAGLVPIKRGGDIEVPSRT